MPSVSSETEIANLALQILGAGRVVSFGENSAEAVAVRGCYTHERDTLLRKHTWNFALKQEQIAEDATPPKFGAGHRYALPSDFLRLAPATDGNVRDWRIVGGFIHTDDGAPLNFEYIARITNPNEFDPCFVDALAAMIAEQICEELTGSNSKIATAIELRREAIREAKRTDAIEDGVAEPPDCTWVQARRGY